VIEVVTAKRRFLIASATRGVRGRIPALSSRACGILHAAQMKTTWGRQRQRPLPEAQSLTAGDVIRGTDRRS